MKNMILGWCIVIGLSVSQEHPEHPKEHPSEHPEHPSEKTKNTITIENLADALENYVNADSKLKGGYFLVLDDKTDAVLKLRLKKIHKDRLSGIGRDTYFACADFKADNGKVYDLDLFMSGKTQNDLNITEVTVHKEDGKARYSWYEKRGIWKRKY